MKRGQPNYYSIIPANVRYDEELKPNEKLLYGEITSLANKSGFCWANNQYFSELYGVTKETVSRWVSNLEQKGYIKVELIYKEGTKQVDKRQIYIADPLLTKKSIPSLQKNQYPIDKKRKDNNTSINNTSTNKDHSPAKAERIPYKEIIDYLNEQTGRRYSHSANKNQVLIRARWNEGFRVEDFKQVVDTKVKDWGNDSKMNKYLRPVTLFSNKFDDYLNQDVEVNKTTKPAGSNYIEDWSEFEDMLE